MARNTAQNNLPATIDLTEDALRGITTLEEAFQYFQNNSLTVADATTELGSGFTLTENKTQFDGVPLMLVKWDFYSGRWGTDFVAAYVLTENAGRFIINDGGTGICSQLQAYTERTKRQNGLLCPRGLTFSKYQVCQECNTSCAHDDDECPQCHSERLGPAQTCYIA